MTSDTVRIGIVGAGDVTRSAHIPGFRAIDGVEVVSVTNRSRESSGRVAAELSIPKVYDSWEELVAAPDTDAICVGTWPNMHHALVVAALRNGKHVLTEARMAMNAREAREMLEASRAAPHLVTQVVPAGFTFKVDKLINELIVDGYLGDLRSVDVAASNGFVDPTGKLTWRKDRDLSGYNTLMLGPWYECMTRWLGPATSVVALASVNVPTRLDDAGRRRSVEVADHVEVVCEMASGPIAHVRVSEVTGFRANLPFLAARLRWDAAPRRRHGLGRSGSLWRAARRLRPRQDRRAA